MFDWATGIAVVSIPKTGCHRGISAKDGREVSVPRTVNGMGHTGPSEFCATSI